MDFVGADPNVVNVWKVGVKLKKLYTLLVFNNNTTLFKSALNAFHIPFQFPS